MKVNKTFSFVETERIIGKKLREAIEIGLKGRLRRWGWNLHEIRKSVMLVHMSHQNYPFRQLVQMSTKFVSKITVICPSFFLQ